MVYANQFSGSNDSEILNAAILGRDSDGIVVITPRVSENAPERDYWLLDNAILLPENNFADFRIVVKSDKLSRAAVCHDFEERIKHRPCVHTQPEHKEVQQRPRQKAIYEKRICFFLVHNLILSCKVKILTRIEPPPTTFVER